MPVLHTREPLVRRNQRKKPMFLTTNCQMMSLSSRLWRGQWVSLDATSWPDLKRINSPLCFQLISLDHSPHFPNVPFSQTITILSLTGVQDNEEVTNPKSTFPKFFTLKIIQTDFKKWPIKNLAKKIGHAAFFCTTI
jgi:hypothetical protein